MKRSRSKYFEYLRDDLVDSLVLSGAGVYALVPPSWYDKQVKVMILYQDHSDVFYSRVKRIRSRGFIPIPSIYTSQRVLVELLPDKDELVSKQMNWLFDND